MFKRNTVSRSLLSAFALAALCLFSAASAAQTGNQTTTGAPLRGVDVKLGKNPGGILATRTTDSNGKIDWGVLAKGSYYLMVVGPGGDANGETYIVEITGASGGPVKRGWDPKKQKAFALPTNAQSNAAASAYTDTDTITFVASGEPASIGAKGAKGGNPSIVAKNAKGGDPSIESTIVKSKSNITNN